ncbi:MAG: polymerase [Treponema sp.]|nr:polymerase [Treponema sp.]
MNKLTTKEHKETRRFLLENHAFFPFSSLCASLYLFVFFFFLLVAAPAFAENGVSMSGIVEWDRMKISASLSLELAPAGIRLPAARTRGEALIGDEYLRLIRPGILGLLADSSSTVADLIGRGEWSLAEAENLALTAGSVPPAMTPDLRYLSASYTLGIDRLSAALFRHTRPAETLRTLSPVAAPAYTGIIIIASEDLPIHGRRASAKTVPCLFPKIWDTDMNLIFERGMLEPAAAIMAHYASARDIFADSPSGLSAEAASLVGERPLRIFARGVFGINPTDPIIDREDALLIISREENRRLLREGRVLIVLDDSVLKHPLSAELM